MWEREESLMEEIQLAWTKIRSKQDLEGVKDKLNETMATLQVWSNEKFGSVEKELKELRRKLEKLQQAYNPDDLNEIDEVQKRMDELLIREELMWLQRSRVTWLREGDKNTSFFHRKASNRSRKNKIKKLKLDDDSFAENNEEMKEVVTDFLRNCIRKT
jgi:Skp family chaperone for outer membrane proteins